mgnify:CR=1 FL=1
MNIGWGKKETQFHGSEGKPSLHKKENPVSELLSKDDDFQPRLSWRGDGEFFVCSSIDQNKGKKKIHLKDLN